MSPSGIACKGEPELNTAAEQGHAELPTEGLGVSDSQVESQWLSTCPSQLQPHVSGLEDGGPAWVSRSPLIPAQCLAPWQQRGGPAAGGERDVMGGMKQWAVGLYLQAT